MSAISGAGLGKLTEIADNTDGLEITLTGVELNTDGIETKQDTQQVTLDAQEATLDDVVHMLTQIANLLMPIGTRDTSMRQKVYVEGIEGVSLGNPISTGFSNEAGSAGICQNSTTTRYYQHVFTGPVDQRFFLMDQARATYANSIRANLSFN